MAHPPLGGSLWSIFRFLVGERSGGLVRLAAALEEERERWILWLPVVLAVGIGLYFALPHDRRPCSARRR